MCLYAGQYEGKLLCVIFVVREGGVSWEVYLLGMNRWLYSIFVISYFIFFVSLSVLLIYMMTKCITYVSSENQSVRKKPHNIQTWPLLHSSVPALAEAPCCWLPLLENTQPSITHLHKAATQKRYM